jgi:hypothetical protein
MNLDRWLRLRSKVKRHKRASRSRAGTYSFSDRCNCDCAKPAKRSIRGRWIISAPRGATDAPCSRPANSHTRSCEESFAFASHRAARIVAAGHDKISLRGALRTRRRSNAQVACVVIPSPRRAMCGARRAQLHVRIAGGAVGNGTLPDLNRHLRNLTTIYPARPAFEVFSDRVPASNCMIRTFLIFLKSIYLSHDNCTNIFMM